MLARSDYPAGVPCWVDILQPDLDATMAFYGGLFDWTFEVRTPEGFVPRYTYAHLDGLIVAGAGDVPPGNTDPTGWNTYITVESADATVALVEEQGGRVIAPPLDIGSSGRVAVCADPSGAVFGVWQARDLRGAQLVNAPGSWNFSGLHVRDTRGAADFYGAVFGWLSDTLEMGGGQETGMWRVKGYGDFLAESDPEIRERQEADGAPEGFADAVALLTAMPDAPANEPAFWSVTFAVADADAAFARAVELGAQVTTPLFDTDYTRMGTVEDPQGAAVTLSQFRPPAHD